MRSGANGRQKAHKGCGCDDEQLPLDAALLGPHNREVPADIEDLGRAVWLAAEALDQRNLFERPQLEALRRRGQLHVLSQDLSLYDPERHGWIWDMVPGS